MVVDSATGNPADLSEDEKTAIHLQMERLLANPYFSHSRRFPSFLRFVIKHTMSKQTDLLKERTLGIEIFGKSADYDTASDPIVRVTATEIRKRIAQYYQDPGHEDELRISLPIGSYIPQFHWPHGGKQEGVPQPLPPAPLELCPVEPPALPPPVIPHHDRRWRTAFLICGAALAIACIALAFFWNSKSQTSYDYFWGPILSSSDPVLFCVADQNQYSVIALRDAADPSHQIVLPDSLTALVMDDLSPIVRMAGVLQAHARKYSLKGEGATTLTDLQAGPTVFIGAFDNAWTLRLTKPLRYHFANNTDMTQFSIVDSNAPAKTSWTVNRTQQRATNNYRDYAIVARFTDSNTGRIAIVAAGVGRGGTIAAGEFLTNPGDLALLQHAAEAAGSKKNLEIVLSTQIIDGEPGTPRMEASYFW
ncbi:MAG TPA: hypothetical protein VGU67_13405 [Edaphobacter sp.]|nr:hypothetical protein [Edaphobacter sp.]